MSTSMSSIVESLDETICNGRLIHLSWFAHDFIEAPWTMQRCPMALSFETIVYLDPSVWSREISSLVEAIDEWNSQNPSKMQLKPAFGRYFLGVGL